MRAFFAFLHKFYVVQFDLILGDVYCQFIGEWGNFKEKTFEMQTKCKLKMIVNHWKQMIILSHFTSMLYSVAKCHSRLLYYQKLRMRSSLVSLSQLVKSVTKMVSGCLRLTKVAIFVE